jgi:hypothetical protein
VFTIKPSAPVRGVLTVMDGDEARIIAIAHRRRQLGPGAYFGVERESGYMRDEDPDPGKLHVWNFGSPGGAIPQNDPAL